MKMSQKKTAILALMGLTILTGCNLLNQSKSEEVASSTASSSSSLGVSSSSVGSSSSTTPLPAQEKATLDTLLKEMQQQAVKSGDSSEIKLIQSLTPDCQLKYLQMSGDSSSASSAFFGDTKCFGSVVDGMTPPDLNTECKTLYQAPFNYYQANWSVIEACQNDAQAGTAPTVSCKNTMDGLVSQTKAFHDKCGIDPQLPWEKDMQNNPQPEPQPNDSFPQFPDSTQQQLQELKTFCADPANANTADCMQFVKCEPLISKMMLLGTEVEKKQSMCPMSADSMQMTSTDSQCYMDIQKQYEPQLQTLQDEMIKQGCIENDPMPSDSTMPAMMRRW